MTSRLTYANVVSTLCLFLLLGGAAWAATSLPKNSVGTPQLKNGAVTGAKVKNGSLTGADIEASTLGQVPSAATAGTAASAAHATGADTAARAAAAGTADHAASADTATTAGDAKTLDGIGPSAFLPAGRVPRISYEGHSEGEPVAPLPILTVGPLTLSAQCAQAGEAGARNLLQIVATGPTGSTMDYGQTIGGSTKVGVYSLDPAALEVVERLISTETESISAFVTFVYRDTERTISIPLSIFVASASDSCRVTGNAVVAE